MQKEEPVDPVPPFLRNTVVFFLFKSFNKFENGIVCRVSDFLPAQYKIMETTVDSADHPAVGLSHLHSPLLEHEGIENGVTGLELRSPVASVNLPAAVHNQYGNCYL